MVFQERTYSVLVVSASAAFDRTVSDLLPRNDFFPVNMVKSCGEARRALLDKEYDIVLINAPSRTTLVCVLLLTCAAPATLEFYCV